MELELGLRPDDAPRLRRLRLLAPLRSGRPRSHGVRIVWHDGPDRALARQGLALAEQRPVWRLERLLPDGQTWSPGTRAPVLATGHDPSALGQALPEPLVPVAALIGRTTSLCLNTERGPVGMTLLNGTVRAVTSEHQVCRIGLEGAPEAVQPLALALAGEIWLAVPCASLAAEAAAAVSGAEPPPRHEGAAELPAGVSVAEAFAHVVGHLTDVILYFAPKAARAGDGPEPVHQMRVAVRRLRSVIKVFGSAIDTPDVAAADRGLKALGARLAPARDWDVFVTETGALVAETFPAEQRVRHLLGAAERRQRACHRELRSFLDSVEFRRLGVELACLSGSRQVVADAGETDLLTFAAGVLHKRLGKLSQVEDDLTTLEPGALHALRLRAKQLRYAAEIFAPLYSGKATHRFIHRLSRLQDRLGTLNDAAVASDLIAGLGGNHAFASGLVLGFIGAHNSGKRERIAEAWHKFRQAVPFWG